MNSVFVTIYNYKSSNLVDCVRSVIENASPNVQILGIVYDQHPLIRKDKLKDFSQFEYEHVFWDHQYTPINYKKKEALSRGRDYFISMSADITLSKDWDIPLINFIKHRNDVIVSGRGQCSVRPHDKYFIRGNWDISSGSQDFSLSNYIDRNFICATRDGIRKLEFPIWMKYLGEEEMMSIDAFIKGVAIYSAPPLVYEDNYDRNLENLYSPFSIEHQYNSFIDYINDESIEEHGKILEFFDFHGIDHTKIKKLPYEIDDVLYDPNTLKIVSLGGERFIDSVKAIY